MWDGPPRDVEGECNAHLLIGDDHGDNHATMRCSLPAGHGGVKKEEYNSRGKAGVVTWHVDEREDEEDGESGEDV